MDVTNDFVDVLVSCSVSAGRADFPANFSPLSSQQGTTGLFEFDVQSVPPPDEPWQVWGQPRKYISVADKF